MFDESKNRLFYCTLLMLNMMLKKVLVSKLSFPEIFKSDPHVTDISFHPAASRQASFIAANSCAQTYLLNQSIRKM